jgi:hypothetical protein
MTCTVISLIVPSQAVIKGAIGGLVALLVVAQLVDYEGSAFRFVSRSVSLFSIPLLVWFAFNMIIQVARIIAV